MSDPSIIGSGKPHTVSLAEGSSVATQRHARPASGPLPEDVPLPVREGQAPAPVDNIARMAAQLRSNRDAKTPVIRRTEPSLAAASDLAPNPLLTRIAQLEQRNGAIRARLDSTTGASGKAPGETR